MKNKLISLILCVMTVFGVCGGIGVFADDASDHAGSAEEIIDSIIGYNLASSGSADVQDWINDTLADITGTASEWYIIALMQDGDYDFSVYRESLVEYLAENRVSSVSTKQKYAFILKALDGGDEYISSVMDSIGEQGIMSYVWGMHLLNNGCVSGSYTSDSAAEQIISMQLEDGGWAVSGKVSDIDVTAMTVQALAPYYGSDDSVRAAIDSAVELLSLRQLGDGDYSSYGAANPESTAQVIIALSSLGIDFMSDTRFIKDGATLLDGVKKYALPDGGYCHSEGGEQNSLAAAQVYLAFSAYLGMLEGDDGIYILDGGSGDMILTETLSDDPSETETAAVESIAAETVLTETSAPDITQAEEIPVSRDSGVSYKVWVSAVVIGAALLVCLILTLAGKRSLKNYLAVFIFASAAVLFVLFTDFRTAEDYYSGESAVKEDVIGSVTMSIRCDTVAGMDDHIPEDGVILDLCDFEISAGDTVYTILTEAAREYGIHIENSGNEKLAYIAGIANIYEYDFGELSGWMFFVNGEKSSVGCGEYVLKDGDAIEWIYTREMGSDVGK